MSSAANAIDSGKEEGESALAIDLLALTGSDSCDGGKEELSRTLENQVLLSDSFS